MNDREKRGYFDDRTKVRTSLSTNNVRFGWGGQSGYYYDWEIDLYMLGMGGGGGTGIGGPGNIFNPSTGRMQGPDPLRAGGGNINIFILTGNNPITNKDPSGRDAQGFPWDIHRPQSMVRQEAINEVNKNSPAPASLQGADTGTVSRSQSDYQQRVQAAYEAKIQWYQNHGIDVLSDADFEKLKPQRGPTPAETALKSKLDTQAASSAQNSPVPSIGAELGQGLANVGQAVQNTAVGTVNLVPQAVNLAIRTSPIVQGLQAAGLLSSAPQLPTVPNPQWSPGLVAEEYGGRHNPFSNKASVAAGELSIAAFLWAESLASKAGSLTIAERQALVAARPPAELATRAERAAMLQLVRTDLAGARGSSYAFQASIARRYWQILLRYDTKTFLPGGNPLGEIDIELRNAMIESVTGKAGSKFNQLEAYQSMFQNPAGKPVALFGRDIISVNTTANYLKIPNTTIIGGSDWDLLDAFVYQGVRH